MNPAQRDFGLCHTMCCTCFIKMVYYEGSIFKKVNKHWRNN